MKIYSVFVRGYDYFKHFFDNLIFLGIAVIVEKYKISIAMPLYQGERFLADCLQSIYSQSFQPYELVLSDDGSTDNTINIAKKFSETVLFNVKIVQNSSSGVTSNYLNALRYCTGDIVVFSDQDDIWLEGKLKRIVQLFSENAEIAIVSSDSELVDFNLKPLGTTIRNGEKQSGQLCQQVEKIGDCLCFLKGLPLLAHTLAIRSCCVKAILDKPDKPANWWFENWVSSVSICYGKLVLIPEVLTLYRQHDSQAAGAPQFFKNRKNNLNKSIVLYKEIVERINFCKLLMHKIQKDTLLNTHDYNQRLELFQECIEYYNMRILLSIQPVWYNYIALKILLSGYYSKFGSGVLSFIKDLFGLKVDK